MSAVCSLPRVSDTNQRIGFDVEPMGRHLITGSRDCKAIVYDLTVGLPVATVADPTLICGEWQRQVGLQGGDYVPVSRSLVMHFFLPIRLASPLPPPLVADAVNGVSICPDGTMFALSTGQRHFPLPGADVGSDVDSDGELCSATMGGAGAGASVGIDLASAGVSGPGCVAADGGDTATKSRGPSLDSSTRCVGGSACV
jgi:hypothetical protein